MAMQSGAVLDEALLDFPTLFARQVRQASQRVAVVQDEVEWTYHRLAERAGHYAACLQADGVAPRDHVGICMDRSPEAIAAMLGIMQCGAAFVPLDPEYPAERIAYMIEDAGLKRIVADETYRRRFASQRSGLQGGAPTWVTCVPEAGVPAAVELAADELAYIMYTSGSTGKPKGVQIEHGALAAYCYADIEAYRVKSDDRTLQFSTLCFDIAIEEIFPPLLTGSAIVVRPRERAAVRNELSDIVDRHHVTAVHLATAYWHEWVDLMVAAGQRVPRSLRLIIPTGEKVSVEHYRRWLSLCDHEVLWCNAYGPTEATVSATVYVPDASFDAPQMPIGRPLKRYEAVILDDSQRPVGKDATGELCIGGPALARGYLNRPDLTAKAFVDVPREDGSTRRLYRTGDLARWLPSGDIEFCGRIDHQIKLGSYRIEPGEIETAIAQHPAVLEALIRHDTVENQKYLVAYVATGGQAVAAEALAEFLRKALPPYMIPSRYIFVESFPKTINGKIDVRALPPAEAGTVPRGSGYIAPRNPLERRLAEIYKRVLNVPEVGIEDDFFYLGGSSLLVTQVVSQLTRELDVELPVRDFFAHPTIASVAAHLRGLMGESAGAAEEETRRRRRERLPVVEPLYVPSAGHELFTVRYQPPGQRQNHGIVMCPAVGHEHQRSYRNLQQFAVQMCQRGFDVLRFDFAATGNSSGDCGTFSPAVARENIADMVGHLRRMTDCQRLTVLGIRVGGTLAATSRLEQVDQLILWDPVVDGSEYVALLDRLHLAALRGLHYFNRRRTRGDLDQAFGQEMNQAKRAGLAGLKLPAVPPDVPATVIWTADAARELTAESTGFAGWELRETSDEVDWDDARYTESAFASPGLYRETEQLLLGEMR